MPCASIGFGPVPNIWSATILSEIRSQIGNAWCDCDDEQDDGCPEGVDPTVENGLIFELTDSEDFEYELDEA